MYVIGSIPVDVDCYEPGKDYVGNDLNDGHSTLTDSAKECQQLCIDNPACVGFTWAKDTLVGRERECWLKRKMDTYYTDYNVVSGPKHCGMLILNSHSNL